MNKREFKESVRSNLEVTVDNLSWDEKIAVVKQCILDVERSLEFDNSNKGQPWTDDEMRLVLRTAPTKENCMSLARAFRRSYGSIEQIFRWAAEDQSVINQKRPDDAFVGQIKRIAREVGWRAT